MGGGCSKKDGGLPQLTGEQTGLADVPASVEVVISADVGKLSQSAIVQRSIEQLLAHDQKLAEQWEQAKASCKIDVVDQVKRVLLAIGPAPDGGVGTGPVLLVAIGNVPEADLSACVRSLVGQGGGTLTAKPVGTHTLYQAKDGNRTMFFAYAKPDAVVMSANEAYVTEALGDGPKGSQNLELAGWLRRVDESAGMWAAGRVPGRVASGLVRATEGKVGAGPVAVVGTANLVDGAELFLGAVMPAAADAKSLESYAKAELTAYTAAASLAKLGGVVGKLRIVAEGDTTAFRVALTTDDLNQLLAVLDGGPPPAQDAPPATK
ncbi:MAG TPA: hypothetical protein VGM88_30655 [Kofleriaceae bacterium]